MSKKEHNIEILEGEDEKEDKGEDKGGINHHQQHHSKIWMSDIIDEFYDLLDYYSNIDDRLKWIGVSNILYGPRSSYSIIYDKDIREFIGKFTGLVVTVTNKMNRKKLEIVQDDRQEFNRLMSLNHKKIYSRIAFVLNSGMHY